MPTHTDSDSLRENLRKNIITLVQKMDFSVSTKLPSENWLAAKFDVSRSTIRAVLAELETEGKILRRQGSGTYINTRAFLLGTTLYPRIEMRNIIEKNGYTPHSNALFICQKPAGDDAAFLQCDPKDTLQEVHSLYYADKIPCMYCIDCLKSGVISDLNWKSDSFHNQSLYRAIQQASGIQICWDIIRFRSVNCDQHPEISHLLNLDPANNSTILLEIVNYTENSTPVLLGRIYVNADIIQLNLIRDLTKLQ